MNGVLALQIHKGAPMIVQFRNFRLRTLSAGDQSGTDDTSKTPPVAVEDLKQLQGGWQVTSAEANGEALPSDDISSLVLTIKDRSFSVLNADSPIKGTFTLDASKQPKQMDIRSEAGPEEGQLLPAIYELGPDTLRVCYARQGAPRPSSFATTNDARLLLMTYKRKKD